MINIKENIKPIFWGPDKWRTLFAIIAVYPDNPTKDLMCNVQDEFKLMECNLPCEGCRESYKIFDKIAGTYDLLNHLVLSCLEVVHFYKQLLQVH